MANVSIIVPNYNHEAFLKQRLDSIFNQTYQDFEVLLLDDASTDGSQAILKAYKNHPKVSHLVINTENTGSPFKQWQKGIELAKGNYLWIAESDDYCENNFLEILIPLLQKGVGLAYCQTIDVDEQGSLILHRSDYTQSFVPNIWEENFTMEGKTFTEKYLLNKNVIPNASAVVFKKALLTPSLFHEDLLQMRMCGDWWFWIQVCMQTKVSFVTQPLNFFRDHQAVTRRHSNINKKKQRLVEESILRKNVYKSYGLYNKELQRKMYKKWFHNHGLWAIFTPTFYQIKSKYTRPLFLLSFLKYQLGYRKKRTV